MNDQRPRNVEPTATGDVPLTKIIELLADNAEIRSNPTSLSPTAGRVAKDASDGTIWLGDGDSWLDVEHEVGADLAGLPGVTIVRSADDLPDASDGVRTLEDGVAYLFADIIADPATLRLGDPSPLIGWHGSQGGYIHTGGSAAIRSRGEPMMMRDFYAHAPAGSLFDLEADTTTEMLVESSSFSDAAGLGNMASLGTVNGYRVPTWKGCNFEDFNAGLSFTGTPDKIFIWGSPFRGISTAGVSCITLQDTLDVDIVDLPGNYGKDWQADTEFVRTEAGGEPTDVLQIRGTTFDGSVTRSNILTGTLDETSVRVNVESSWPLADSSPSASYSLDGSATVSFTAQDPGDGSEAVKIDGIATTVESAVTDRFTHTSPNRLTYDGRRDFKARADCTISLSGSNTTAAVYFVKNGTVLNRTKVDITTASAGQPRTASLTSRIPMVPNDWVEVWLANEGGTGDIEVSTLEVTI